MPRRSLGWRAWILNRFHRIYHRSPQAQADLAVLRSWDALVRSRTLLINHVRDIVKSTGRVCPHVLLTALLANPPLAS
jgi:hypothetical protein